MNDKQTLVSTPTLVSVIRIPRERRDETASDVAHRVFDRLSRFCRVMHVVAGPDRSGGWRVAIRRLRAGEAKS